MTSQGARAAEAERPRFVQSRGSKGEGQLQGRLPVPRGDECPPTFLGWRGERACSAAATPATHLCAADVAVAVGGLQVPWCTATGSAGALSVPTHAAGWLPVGSWPRGLWGPAVFPRSQASEVGESGPRSHCAAERPGPGGCTPAGSCGLRTHLCVHVPLVHCTVSGTPPPVGVPRGSRPGPASPEPKFRAREHTE